MRRAFFQYGVPIAVNVPVREPIVVNSAYGHTLGLERVLVADSQLFFMNDDRRRDACVPVEIIDMLESLGPGLVKLVQECFFEGALM